jgi:cytochrome c5
MRSARRACSPECGGAPARRAGVAAVLLLGGAVAISGCGESGWGAPPEGSFTALVSGPPAKAPAASLAASAGRPAPAPPDPALWETPQSDPRLEAGRQVWIGTCIACHATGLGGAPLIGNRALWEPRLAKGLDVLVEHAMRGFYGNVGEMPARGGNESLSDAQVRAAVHFMTSRVRR